MDSTSNDFKFDAVEYIVVAAMLLLSILIGVYYSFFNKQETFKDYMLGGKTMGVFPVSMSIVASFASWLTLLGIPTEVYLYGTQEMAFNFVNVFLMIITMVFYLPVFYKLQLNSLFEYLELRFNHTVRIIGSLLYSVTLIAFLPLVIYVPALAFNQVTGVSVRAAIPILSVICIFYTAFGGVRAVIWTDVLQNTFTLVAVVFIVVISCVRLGGVQEIWRINQEGHRLEMLNLDPDPFSRSTFWTVIFGGTMLHLTNMAVSPGSVQRYLSVPSLRKARLVIFISCVAYYVIVNQAAFLGMILYARYHDCDPVAAGVIKNFGQMVPLYVMEISKGFPGLAGLFMSAILSAALSTKSALLNTVAGTLYKDVMEVFFPQTLHSEKVQSRIIRVIVIVFSITCVALIAIVEKLGTLFQMGISLLGIAYGSILSLFSLGIFFPRANVKGAVVGSIASLLLTGWIVGHAQYYIAKGKLRFPGKITSVDGCPVHNLNNVNTTSAPVFTYTGVGSPVEADDVVPRLYQLCFSYYGLIGTLTGIIVGLVVSYLTEPPDLESMNPDLFSSYVHFLLPRKKESSRPKRDEYFLTELKDRQSNKDNQM